MNLISKIILIYVLLSAALFGVLQLEADNINDPFYNKRVNSIKVTLSNEEISGFSFAYGVDAEQCFHILTERNLSSSQYSECKSFIDDLHSESLSDL